MTLTRLAHLDASLDGTRRSLAPDRTWATPLVTLAERVVDAPLDAPLALAFTNALADIAEAIAVHFPGNLFADYDLLAATLWRDARDDTAPSANVDQTPCDFLRQQATRIVALHRVFGASTAIRFQYIHDFVYGFDWARWVQRESVARAGVGPFDAPFLDAMLSRSQELLELISGDDAKYHTLRGDGPRNPFPFSREPEDECKLHRLLAREGNIPVEAWRLVATPRADRPYSLLREQTACGLGLTKATSRA